MSSWYEHLRVGIEEERRALGRVSNVCTVITELRSVCPCPAILIVLKSRPGLYNIKVRFCVRSGCPLWRRKVHRRRFGGGIDWPGPAIWERRDQTATTALLCATPEKTTARLIDGLLVGLFLSPTLCSKQQVIAAVPFSSTNSKKKKKEGSGRRIRSCALIPDFLTIRVASLMCAKGPEDWIAMDALGSYCSASDREEEERYNAGLGCRNEMEGGGGMRSAIGHRALETRERLN